MKAWSALNSPARHFYWLWTCSNQHWQMDWHPKITTDCENFKAEWNILTMRIIQLLIFMGYKPSWKRIKKNVKKKRKSEIFHFGWSSRKHVHLYLGEQSLLCVLTLWPCRHVTGLFKSFRGQSKKQKDRWRKNPLTFRCNHLKSNVQIHRA